MSTEMPRRYWWISTLGCAIALLAGTTLVIAIAMPAFANQEMGIVGVAMWLLCYWGATPALLVPFVFFAVRRRTSTRRVLGRALVVGLLFPIALGLVISFFIPFAYHSIGLHGVAGQFEGELDLDDTVFWCGLLPWALAIGSGLSHLALRTTADETA